MKVSAFFLLLVIVLCSNQSKRRVIFILEVHADIRAQKINIKIRPNQIISKSDLHEEWAFYIKQIKRMLGYTTNGPIHLKAHFAKLIFHLNLKNKRFEK